MFAQTLDAAGLSSEFVLSPGQSCVFTAVTADLEFATLRLDQSANGSVWGRAYDSVDELVPLLEGDGGAMEVEVTLKNETKGPVRYRAELVHTGGEDPLAGEVALTATAANDPAELNDDVVTIGDEGVEFAVPVTAPAGSRFEFPVIFPPVYADNAAALAAGAPAGSLYTDGTAPLIVQEA